MHGDSDEDENNELSELKGDWFRNEPGSGCQRRDERRSRKYNMMTLDQTAS